MLQNSGRARLIFGETSNSKYFSCARFYNSISDRGDKTLFWTQWQWFCKNMPDGRSCCKLEDNKEEIYNSGRGPPTFGHRRSGCCTSYLGLCLLRMVIVIKCFACLELRGLLPVSRALYVTLGHRWIHVVIMIVTMVPLDAGWSMTNDDLETISATGLSPSFLITPAITLHPPIN